MNSSNSFNICPRCGNSNSLNAKYCSRCGAQLKVPEEALVCHKCHTRNSPIANFCRNCGATLRVGAETKICPRCGKEVNAEDNVCACGYSFVTMQQTAPKKGVDVSSTNDRKTKEKKAKNKTSNKDKVYDGRSGRGAAIAALIILLLFAYLIVAPSAIGISKGEEVTTIPLRPTFLTNFDKGVVSFALDEETSLNLYGFEFVALFINAIKAATNPETVADAKPFEVFIGSLGGMAMFITAILVTLFILTAVVHLIVCIVRIINKKRSRRSNLYFLIMAILSTLVAVAMLLFNGVIAIPEGGVLATIGNLFNLGDGAVGFVMYAIPLYFWFFFIFSVCAKAKVLKEKTA